MKEVVEYMLHFCRICSKLKPELNDVVYMPVSIYRARKILEFWIRNGTDRMSLLILLSLG